jgi:ribosomal protein L37AE/L43A
MATSIDATEALYKPGDKCPRCREGLIERTELGFECDNCGWNETVTTAVEAAERARTAVGDYKFRAFALRIRVETPEEGEVLLQGCIVAKSNNNSPHFQEMIDGINAQLEPWRAMRLAEEIAARDA